VVPLQWWKGGSGGYFQKTWGRGARWFVGCPAVVRCIAASVPLPRSKNQERALAPGGGWGGVWWGVPHPPHPFPSTIHTPRPVAQLSPRGGGVWHMGGGLGGSWGVCWGSGDRKGGDTRPQFWGLNSIQQETRGGGCLHGKTFWQRARGSGAWGKGGYGGGLGVGKEHRKCNCCTRFETVSDDDQNQGVTICVHWVSRLASVYVGWLECGVSFVGFF